MKHVVITGTSRGIGKALLSVLLEEEEVRVYALSRHLPNDEELVNALSIKHIPCDLTDQTSIDKAVELIKEDTSEVDVLIHNAGMLVNKPFLNMSDEDLTLSLGVNFKGPYQLSQSLVPMMVSSDQAHIVMISSVGGVTGSSKFPGLSAYSSSKGALTILGECLAVELEELSIAVNVLALGSVQTEMLNAAFPGYVAQATPESMASYIWRFASTAQGVVSGKTHEVGKSGV